MQRKRFVIHLRKYHQQYGNNGYILLGDFRKFFDNILHDVSKNQILELFDYDEFMDWMLSLIFKGFEIDVSFLSDNEYPKYFHSVFDRIEYDKIPKDLKIAKRMMPKSVDIGDQFSQTIGIYYPHRIDNYIKYVRGFKFYGRYTDDWYLMCNDRAELIEIQPKITEIAESLGITINKKKTKIVRINKPITYLQCKYLLTDSGKVLCWIKPKHVASMRKKLRKLSVKVNNGERKVEDVMNMFCSWMGNYRKLLTRRQRKELVKLVEELFDVDCYIEHKKLKYQKQIS